MHEVAATPAWVLVAYLISGVCFILALRGLSSPTSSRRGNYIGMAGMAIAVVTTLMTHIPGGIYSQRVRPPSAIPHDIYRFIPDYVTVAEIVAAIIIGGGIGLVTARKIQMTAMP